MKRLFLLLVPLVVGCGFGSAELAPITPKATVPVSSPAEVAAPAAQPACRSCDCDARWEQCGDEHRAFATRLAKLESTKPADNAGPPKPPAKSTERASGRTESPAGGDCSSDQCGARGRIFGRRR